VFGVIRHEHFYAVTDTNVVAETGVIEELGKSVSAEIGL
jgi:hypothetical protein